MTEHALILFNAGGSILVSAVCGWVILSPRIDEGLVSKIGLAAVALGHFGAASLLLDGSVEGDILGLLRAQAIVRVGMVIAAAGYVWHHTAPGQRARAHLVAFFGSVTHRTHNRRR